MTNPEDQVIADINDLEASEEPQAADFVCCSLCYDEWHGLPLSGSGCPGEWASSEARATFRAQADARIVALKESKGDGLSYAECQDVYESVPPRLPWIVDPQFFAGHWVILGTLDGPVE